MTAHAHTFPAGPTLEALRIQGEAYAASGGEAAVTYDKLRDELVLASQRLPDQKKQLSTARDLRTAVEVPQERSRSGTPDGCPCGPAVNRLLTEPAACSTHCSAERAEGKW